jgi:hypothetical protein
MACTSPSNCADVTTCCIPRPLGAFNSLGFNGKNCCKTPCMDFPPHNVQICMTVNRNSVVYIETGCALPTDTGCVLKFSPAASLSSWGKACRTINWSRYVRTYTVIRIRICKNDADCSAACTTDYGGYTEDTVPNKLSRFSVDGREFTGVLSDVAFGRVAGIEDGNAGQVPDTCLLKAACIGANTGAPAVVGDTCCQWFERTGNPVVSWADGVGSAGLNDLPIGTEIVFGPIGQVFL